MLNSIIAYLSVVLSQQYMMCTNFLQLHGAILITLIEHLFFESWQ